MREGCGYGFDGLASSFRCIGVVVLTKWVGCSLLFRPGKAGFGI